MLTLVYMMTFGAVADNVLPEAKAGRGTAHFFGIATFHFCLCTRNADRCNSQTIFVCPSVSLSVTFSCFVQTNELRSCGFQHLVEQSC